MRIRTRLLVAFGPVIAVALVVLGTLAVVSNRVANSANVGVVDDLSTTYERVDDAARKLSARLEADRQTRDQLVANRVVDDLQRGVTELQALNHMLAATAGLAEIISTADDGAIDSASIKQAVDTWNLTEVSVVDLGGAEQARWGGLFLPPGAERLSEARPVPNGRTDESKTGWFVHWGRQPVGSVVTHIGIDQDLGANRGALSIIGPVIDAQGTVVGALRVAKSIEMVFDRVVRSGISLGSAQVAIDNGGDTIWVLDSGRTTILDRDGFRQAADRMAAQIVESLGAGVGSLVLLVPEGVAVSGSDVVEPARLALEHAIGKAEAARDRTDGWLAGISIMLTVAVAAVIAGGAVAYWWFSRSVVGPLSEIDDAICAVGGGDLGVELPEPRNDEIGDVARSLTAACTNMKQRISELEHGNVALEEATRMKSAFLAHMSHEIRTPMNGVIGMTELLATTTLDGEQRELNGTLYRSAEAAMSIIDEVLDLSRIEAGEMDLQSRPFNVRTVAEEAARIVADKAQAKNLEVYVVIDPAIDCLVLGDERRVEQILLNLLSNAVKYTDKGHIKIQLDLVAHEDDALHLGLAVSDTGIGLAAGDIERIFEPYVRADHKETSGFTGSGLGLSICRELARMMGSSISVESEIGRGSTFRMTLQLPKGKRLSWPKSLDRLQVLLVSGDDHLARNVDGVMGPCGLTVDRGRTLESAEALIAGAKGDESPYDVVFWDKRVFGDDPTCSITRGDNPDHEPYHALLVPMGVRGTLPELVVACFDRVLTRPLRTPVVIETLTAVAVADRPSPSLKSDSDADADSRRSLAGRVLLVEDNEVNRTVARRQLEGMDLDVVEAQDGLQALAALDRETFDLILMDCEMPNLDGYHSSEEIRMGEDGADYRIPIIAMTARTSDADRQRCMDCGMDAFIAKPVRAETMYLVLRQFLRPGIHRQQHRSSGPA